MFAFVAVVCSAVAAVSICVCICFACAVHMLHISTMHVRQTHKRGWNNKQS